MSEHTTSYPTGISRRDLLRRGALLGGAVVWMTPVVQTVGMSRAHAQPPSPACVRYALKWEADDNSEVPGESCEGLPVWSNNWVHLGTPPPQAPSNCLTAPMDAVNLEQAAQNLTSNETSPFVVYGSRETGFWVAYPSSCFLANLADEVDPGAAAAKCGRDGCNVLTKEEAAEEPDPCLEGYTRVFIGACDIRSEISHIELIIDCCPE